MLLVISYWSIARQKSLAADVKFTIIATSRYATQQTLNASRCCTLQDCR